MSFKIQDVPTLAKHYRRNPDEGRHPADVALALGRESPHLRRKDEAFNSLYKSIKSARRDDFVTAFGKQLLHGIDITEASLFGSAGYVGDLIGSDTVRDWGYDGFKRNMLEAEERAPTVSLQDIKEGELAGIPAFITGTIAEVVPSVAAMFTGAGIPAGLGGLVLKMGGKKAVHKLVSKSIAKQLAKEMPKKKFTDLQLRKEIRKRYKKEVETRAAKLLGPRALGKEAAQKSARQRAIKSIEKEAKGKLFRRNFQRGTTFSGIVQNLGEIAGGFDLDDPSVTRGERLLYGGIGGVLAGVLDSLLPRAILRSLTPEAKKTFMTKAIDKYKDFAEKRPVVAAALVAPGATSVQEGLTEGAQEFIGYLANNLPNEDVPFDWGDVAHRVEEAGVKGAVGGGGIGFGFGALNAVVQSGSRKSEKARRRNEQAIKNARETYQSDTGVHMYGSHRTDDQQDDLSEPSSPKFNPADQDRKTRLNVSEAKNLVGKYIAGDLTSKEAVKFNALTLTNRDEVNNPVASVLKEGRRKRLQFLMEQVGTGDTLTGVTMEAIDILNTIDDGGSVPTEVTKKLARIARDNGIDLHQEIADKAPVLENYDQRNVEGFLTGDDKVKVEGIRESIQTSKIVEQVAFGLARKKDPLSRDARTGIDTDFGTTPAWSADSEVHAWLDAVLDGITDPKEAKKKLEEAQKDQVRRRESLEEEATQLAEEGLAKLSLNERFKGVTPEMREEVLSRSSLEGRADDDLHSQVDTPLRDKAIAYITGKSKKKPKAPTVAWRGTGVEDIDSGIGARVHITPWASVATKAGKFGRGGDQNVWRIKVSPDTKWYRGGALAESPLERAYDSIEGKTWDQMLDIAKADYNRRVKNMAQRTQRSGKKIGMSKKEISESVSIEAKGIGQEVFGLFKNATFEADLYERDGIYVGKTIPQDLREESPELLHNSEIGRITGVGPKEINIAHLQKPVALTAKEIVEALRNLAKVESIPVTEGAKLSPEQYAELGVLLKEFPQDMDTLVNLASPLKGKRRQAKDGDLTPEAQTLVDNLNALDSKMPAKGNPMTQFIRKNIKRIAEENNILPDGKTDEQLVQLLLERDESQKKPTPVGEEQLGFFDEPVDELHEFRMLYNKMFPSDSEVSELVSLRNEEKTLLDGLSDKDLTAATKKDLDRRLGEVRQEIAEIGPPSESLSRLTPEEKARLKEIQNGPQSQAISDQLDLLLNLTDEVLGKKYPDDPTSDVDPLSTADPEFEAKTRSLVRLQQMYPRAARDIERNLEMGKAALKPDAHSLIFFSKEELGLGKVFKVTEDDISGIEIPEGEASRIAGQRVTLGRLLSLIPGVAELVDSIDSLGSSEKFFKNTKGLKEIISHEELVDALYNQTQQELYNHVKGRIEDYAITKIPKKELLLTAGFDPKIMGNVEGLYEAVLNDQIHQSDATRELVVKFEEEQTRRRRIKKLNHITDDDGYRQYLKEEENLFMEDLVKLDHRTLVMLAEHSGEKGFDAILRRLELARNRPIEQIPSSEYFGKLDELAQEIDAKIQKKTKDPEIDVLQEKVKEATAQGAPKEVIAKLRKEIEDRVNLQDDVTKEVAAYRNIQTILFNRGHLMYNPDFEVATGDQLLAERDGLLAEYSRLKDLRVNQEDILRRGGIDPDAPATDTELSGDEKSKNLAEAEKPEALPEVVEAAQLREKILEIQRLIHFRLAAVDTYRASLGFDIPEKSPLTFTNYGKQFKDSLKFMGPPIFVEPKYFDKSEQAKPSDGDFDPQVFPTSFRKAIVKIRERTRDTSRIAKITIPEEEDLSGKSKSEDEDNERIAGSVNYEVQEANPFVRNLKRYPIKISKSQAETLASALDNEFSRQETTGRQEIIHAIDEFLTTKEKDPSLQLTSASMQYVLTTLRSFVKSDKDKAGISVIQKLTKQLEQNIGLHEFEVGSGVLSMEDVVADKTGLPTMVVSEDVTLRNLDKVLENVNHKSGDVKYYVAVELDGVVEIRGIYWDKKGGKYLVSGGTKLSLAVKAAIADGSLKPRESKRKKGQTVTASTVTDDIAKMLYDPENADVSISERNKLIEVLLAKGFDFGIETQEDASRTPESSEFMARGRPLKIYAAKELKLPFTDKNADGVKYVRMSKEGFEIYNNRVSHNLNALKSTFVMKDGGMNLLKVFMRKIANMEVDLGHEPFDAGTSMLLFSKILNATTNTDPTTGEVNWEIADDESFHSLEEKNATYNSNLIHFLHELAEFAATNAPEAMTRDSEDVRRFMLGLFQVSVNPEKNLKKVLNQSEDDPFSFFRQTTNGLYFGLFNEGQMLTFLEYQDTDKSLSMGQLINQFLVNSKGASPATGGFQNVVKNIIKIGSDVDEQGKRGRNVSIDLFDVFRAEMNQEAASIDLYDQALTDQNVDFQLWANEMSPEEAASIDDGSYGVDTVTEEDGSLAISPFIFDLIEEEVQFLIADIADPAERKQVRNFFSVTSADKGETREVLGRRAVRSLIDGGLLARILNRTHLYEDIFQQLLDITGDSDKFIGIAQQKGDLHEAALTYLSLPEIAVTKQKIIDEMVAIIGKAYARSNIIREGDEQPTGRRSISVEGKKPVEGAASDLFRRRSQARTQRAGSKGIKSSVAKASRKSRVSAGVREEFFTKVLEAFQFHPDQNEHYMRTEVLMTTLDNIARIWAQQNGKRLDDWYNENFQNVIDATAPTNEAASAVAQVARESGKAVPSDVNALVHFDETGRALILAFQNADFKSFVHEIGHVVRRTGLTKAQEEQVIRWLRGGTLKNSQGVETRELSRAEEEQFNVAWEAYFLNGASPHEALNSVFRDMSRYMQESYRGIEKSHLNKVNPTVFSVFNELMAGAASNHLRPTKRETFAEAKAKQARQISMNITAKNFGLVLDFPNIRAEAHERMREERDIAVENLIEVFSLLDFNGDTDAYGLFQNSLYNAVQEAEDSLLNSTSPFQLFSQSKRPPFRSDELMSRAFVEVMASLRQLATNPAAENRFFEAPRDVQETLKRLKEGKRKGDVTALPHRIRSQIQAQGRLIERDARISSSTILRGERIRIVKEILNEKLANSGRQLELIRDTQESLFGSDSLLELLDEVLEAKRNPKIRETQKLQEEIAVIERQLDGKAKMGRAERASRRKKIKTLQDKVDANKKRQAKEVEELVAEQVNTEENDRFKSLSKKDVALVKIRELALKISREPILFYGLGPRPEQVGVTGPDGLSTVNAFDSNTLEVEQAIYDTRLSQYKALERRIDKKPRKKGDAALIKDLLEGEVKAAGERQMSKGEQKVLADLREELTNLKANRDRLVREGLTRETHQSRVDELVAKIVAAIPKKKRRLGGDPDAVNTIKKKRKREKEFVEVNSAVTKQEKNFPATDRRELLNNQNRLQAIKDRLLKLDQDRKAGKDPNENDNASIVALQNSLDLDSRIRPIKDRAGAVEKLAKLREEEVKAIIEDMRMARIDALTTNRRAGAQQKGSGAIGSKHGTRDFLSPKDEAMLLRRRKPGGKQTKGEKLREAFKAGKRESYDVSEGTEQYFIDIMRGMSVVQEGLISLHELKGLASTDPSANGRLVAMNQLLKEKERNLRQENDRTLSAIESEDTMANALKFSDLGSHDAKRTRLLSREERSQAHKELTVFARGAQIKLDKETQKKVDQEMKALLNDGYEQAISQVEKRRETQLQTGVTSRNVAGSEMLSLMSIKNQIQLGEGELGIYETLDEDLQEEYVEFFNKLSSQEQANVEHQPMRLGKFSELLSKQADRLLKELESKVKQGRNLEGNDEIQVPIELGEPIKTRKVKKGEKVISNGQPLSSAISDVLDQLGVGDLMSAEASERSTALGKFPTGKTRGDLANTVKDLDAFLGDLYDSGKVSKRKNLKTTQSLSFARPEFEVSFDGIDNFLRERNEEENHVLLAEREFKTRMGNIASRTIPQYNQKYRISDAKAAQVEVLEAELERLRGIRAPKKERDLVSKKLEKARRRLGRVGSLKEAYNITDQLEDKEVQDALRFAGQRGAELQILSTVEGAPILFDLQPILLSRDSNNSIDAVAYAGRNENLGTTEVLIVTNEKIANGSVTNRNRDLLTLMVEAVTDPWKAENNREEVTTKKRLRVRMHENRRVFTSIIKTDLADYGYKNLSRGNQLWETQNDKFLSGNKGFSVAAAQRQVTRETRSRIQKYNGKITPEEELAIEAAQEEVETLGTEFDIMEEQGATEEELDAKRKQLKESRKRLNALDRYQPVYADTGPGTVLGLGPSTLFETSEQRRNAMFGLGTASHEQTIWNKVGDENILEPYFPWMAVDTPEGIVHEMDKRRDDLDAQASDTAIRIAYYKRLVEILDPVIDNENILSILKDAGFRGDIIESIDGMLAAFPEVAPSTMENLNESETDIANHNLYKLLKHMVFSVDKRLEGVDRTLAEHEIEFEKETEFRNSIAVEPASADSFSKSIDAFFLKMKEELQENLNLNLAKSEVTATLAALDGLVRDRTYNLEEIRQTLESSKTNKLKLLEGVAALGLDWESITHKDALETLNDYQNHELINDLVPSKAKDVKKALDQIANDRGLQAFVVSYAKSRALEMVVLENRLSGAQDRYASLESALKEAQGKDFKTLSEILKEAKKVVGKAHRDDRIRRSILKHQKKFQALKEDIEAHKALKPLLSEVRDLLQAGTNAPADHLGVTEFFDGSSGSQFVEMDPSAVGFKVKKTHQFRASEEDEGEYRAAFFSNADWLERNADLSNVSKRQYDSVLRMTERLRFSIIDKDYKHTKRRMATEFLQSFSDRFNEMGYDGSRLIGHMMTQYNSEYDKWLTILEPKAQQWESAYIKLARLAGYTRSGNQFKQEILTRAYSIMEKDTGVTNLDTIIDNTYRSMVDRVVQLNGVPESQIDTKKLKKAWKSFVLQTKSFSETMDNIRKDADIPIADDEILLSILDEEVVGREREKSFAREGGVEQEKRFRHSGYRTESIKRGLLTVPRSINFDELSELVDIMEMKGWTDSHGKAASSKTETIFWWEGRDPNGSIVRNTLDSSIIKDPSFSIGDKTSLLGQRYGQFLTNEIISGFIEPMMNHEKPLFGSGFTRSEIDTIWTKHRDKVYQTKDLSEWFAEMVERADVDPSEQEAVLLRLSNSFLSQFRVYRRIAEDARRTRNTTDSRTSNHFAVDARVADNVPDKFLQYAQFDKTSVRGMVGKLMSIKYFGKDFGNLQSYLEEAKGEIRSEILNLRALGEDRATEIAELEARRDRLDSSFREFLVWWSDLEDGPNKDARLWSDFVGAQATATIATVSSGLMNVVTPTINFMFAYGGLNSMTARNIAGVVKDLIAEPFISLAEMMGFYTGGLSDERHAMAEFAYDLIKDEVSLFENLAETGKDESLTGAKGAAQRFLRVSKRVASHPLPTLRPVWEFFGIAEKDGRRSSALPSLNAFDFINRIANMAAALGQLRMYRMLVKDLIKVVEAGSVDLTDPTFRFEKMNLPKLGINRGAFDALASNIGQHGLQIETMVHNAMLREENGDAMFTKEELLAFYQISNANITLESNFTTRPVWMVQHPVISSLLGWGFSQTLRNTNAMSDQEGRHSARIWGKFLVTGMVAGGLALGFSEIKDWYNWIFRGRVPRLRKLNQATDAFDAMQIVSERVAETGAFGLGGNIFSHLVTLNVAAPGDPYAFDDRIFAVNIAKSFISAVKDSARQGGMTFETTGNRMIRALGGNAFLQYSEILNNFVPDASENSGIVGDSILNPLKGYIHKVNSTAMFAAAGRSLGIPMKKLFGAAEADRLTAPVKRMQIMMLLDDEVGFAQAYRDAIQSAIRMGEPDPTKRVRGRWAARNPLYSFGSMVEARDKLPEIIGNIPATFRGEAVRSLNNYDKYSKLINSPGNFSGLPPTEDQREADFELQKEEALRKSVKKNLKSRGFGGFTSALRKAG